MRRLTLREYQTTPSVQLSPDERNALSAVVPSLTIVSRRDHLHHYDLTPGSWVGAVDLGSLAVEIRPKIPIDRLLFLIGYTLHRQRWPVFPFSAARHDDLVEAIVAGFLAQVRRAFAWGLLHGYRVQEESLHTVRGSIRFGDQIRDQYGLFPPVEVRYDEFTEDIEENRLLKAARARLGRLRIRSQPLRRGLLSLEGTLAGVQLVTYDARRLPTVRYTRLNEHYRPAVELAKLILRSVSYETRHGAVAASAFLVDMNRVFEDFVALALRDALKLRPSDFPQGLQGRRLRLDRGGKVGLVPDLSWWEGSRCTFVGDVKYKRTQHDDAVHADLYQILAYTVATNLPRGVLIYASGEAPAGPHEVIHLGKVLDVVTLDLDGSPEQLLQQIKDVADHIRRTRSPAV